MSIFFAISGKAIQKNLDRLKYVNSYQKYEEENFTVLVKGNNFLSHSKFGENGFVFCGLPVEFQNNQFKQTKFENYNFDDFDISEFRKRFTGHFSLLIWDNLYIKLFNDYLGISQIYHYNSKSTHIFSNSIEEIINYTGINEFDIYNFSTRIYLSNQLDESSIFQNIDRFGAGSNVELNRKNNLLQIKKTNFEFEFEKGKPEHFHQLISNALSLKINSNDIGLSISGGLDSRYLLAHFLKNNESPKLFAYGNSKHPDNVISKKIAQKFDLHYKNYNFNEHFELINEDKILDFARNFQLHNNMSEVLNKSYYDDIAKNNILIFDGSNGEYARNGLYTLAAVVGYQSFKNKNTEEIIEKFLIKKPINIFNKQTQKLIKSATHQKLINRIETLPKIDDIGFRNWLDLFALKVKYPNFMYFEQSYTDNFLIDINPFSMLPILQSALNMPNSIKNYGNDFKKYIKNSNRKLTQIPLVKHNFHHPFFMNQFLGRIWLRLSKLFNLTFEDKQNIEFYELKKEFFMDIISSIKQTDQNLLDIAVIDQIQNEYFSSNYTNIKQIEQLITYSTYKYSL